MRKITDDYDGYETRYPILLEHVNTQLDKNFWSATEVNVESDALEMKYKLTEDQQNAVKKILLVIVTSILGPISQKDVCPHGCGKSRLL